MLHKDKPDSELVVCFTGFVDSMNSSYVEMKPYELLEGANIILEKFSSNAIICFRCLKATFSNMAFEDESKPSRRQLISMT